MQKRMMILTLAALLTAPMLFAQSEPISGTAAVKLVGASTDAINRGTKVPVSVLIDLTGVKGKLAGGPGAAALGGYLVEVTFDATRLQLESVSGGLTKEFSTDPTYTRLARANEEGRIRLTAAQTGGGPTGVVDVAKLVFTATSAGKADLAVKPLSISSALLAPGVGPTAITGQGLALPLTILANRR